MINMKRSIFVVFALFAVLSISLLVSNVKAPLVWLITDVDTSGSVSGPCSIAVDSSGNPHISYYGGTTDQLKYARWIDTIPGWSVETVDSDSSGRVGRDSSLALDSSGNPHISYCNWTDLKYAVWTGSTWSIETIESVGQRGVLSSIALDSNDDPHISYLDWANGVLKYAVWTGSTWSIETVDSANNDMGCSLALDSFDNPHISYFNGTNGDLKYAMWTGSTWSIETVTLAGSHWETSSSLALDSFDNPHISYHNSTNDGYPVLRYAMWTGSTWSIETIDANATEPSLALDSNNNPHISYRDWTPLMPTLKYAGWTGSAWSIETVDEMGCGWQESSIAVDSNNNPHISYVHWEGLRYATIQVPEVWSTDSFGNPKTTFVPGEDVYVMGSGFPADREMAIRIIPDGEDPNPTNSVASG